MSDHNAYEELARRLCAAYLSYNLGHASVDYTLKHYVQGEVGAAWLQLAENVSKSMTNSIEQRLAPKSSHRPQ
jgi:hypothetical protein